MGRRKSFEEYFIKSGTMYIGDAIPTPKYRRPTPPPPPLIPKEKLWEIPDIDYESPVQIHLSQMQGQLEDGVCKAVQSYGIDVNKDELVKALAYDREQYNKGFRDGVRKFAEMWKEETSNREIIWDTDAAIDIFVKKLVGE